MPPRVAEWSGREGCVTLPIGAQPRSASPPTERRPDIDSQPWPMGDKDATWPAAKGKTKFEQATADMARFGGRTSSLLIVKNGRIALERYLGGHDIHTAQRTFSVAKSMAVTLIGDAVQQDRQSAVQGTSVSVRVEIDGDRIIKKKKKNN